MKRILILVLLLIMPFVSAKIADVSLTKYDSYMKDGINITLMNIDKDKTKFILCVNGESHIVTEEGISKEYFTIKVDDIKKEEVDLRIDIDCDDCVCEGKCNNKRCFPNPKYVYLTKENKAIETEEISGETNVGTYVIIVFIVMLLIIVLLAYYIIKNKLKEQI